MTTMKWMLVVLVGGMTPVNTDLVFDKFADCLAAEEQMRKHYADAFEAWDRWAAAILDRRREYSKARDLQAKRLLGNIGTCVPARGRSANCRGASAATTFNAGSAALPATSYAGATAKPTDVRPRYGSDRFGSPGLSTRARRIGTAGLLILILIFMPRWAALFTSWRS